MYVPHVRVAQRSAPFISLLFSLIFFFTTPLSSRRNNGQSEDPADSTQSGPSIASSQDVTNMEHLRLGSRGGWVEGWKG